MLINGKRSNSPNRTSHFSPSGLRNNNDNKIAPSSSTNRIPFNNGKRGDNITTASHPSSSPTKFWSSNKLLFVLLFGISIFATFQLFNTHNHVVSSLVDPHGNNVDTKRFPPPTKPQLEGDTQPSPKYLKQTETNNQQPHTKEGGKQETTMGISSDIRHQEEEIIKLYGPEVHSLGLNPATSPTQISETCKAWQESVPNEKDRLLGVAGMFNSGTNLLSTLLMSNCKLPKAKYGGIEWQVPWGKHNPSHYRLIHYAPSSKGVVRENVLPIVMIKDPLTWMHSMCRHSYSLVTKFRGCPTLLLQDKKNKFLGEDSINEDEEMLMADFKKYTNNAASVTFPKNRTKYDNMLDVWNTWYTDYIRAPFPKIVIRFEDLLFRQEEIVTSVCSCAGGQMTKEFKYMESSAKGERGAHGGGHGRKQALERYGSEEIRNKDFSELDLAYIDKFADKELMELFHYGDSKGEHNGWVKRYL